MEKINEKQISLIISNLVSFCLNIDKLNLGIRINKTIEVCIMIRLLEDKFKNKRRFNIEYRMDSAIINFNEDYNYIFIYLRKYKLSYSNKNKVEYFTPLKLKNLETRISQPSNINNIHFKNRQPNRY